MEIVIKIDAYQAITIISFLREFVNDDIPNDYKLQHIKECVDEFEQKCACQFMDEHFDYIHEMAEIDSMIGKTPPIRG